MDPKAQMIGQLAQEMPRELNTIQGQLNNILQLSVDFQNALIDKIRSLIDMKTEFDEELKEYKTIIESHHTWLDSLVDKLEHLSESVLKAVNETQDELIQALIEIHKEQLEAIMEMVTHAKEQKKQWWEHWRDGSNFFQQKLSASSSLLEKEVAEVQSSVKSLGQLVAEGRELSHARVENLTQRIQQVHHDAEEKVQSMATMLQEMHQDFSSQLHMVREDNLGPMVGKLLEGFQQKIAAELKPKVEEHTSSLGECISQLSDQLVNSKERSSTSRQSLAPHVDAVQEMVNPIGSALEAAKEAVGKVGLVFG